MRWPNIQCIPTPAQWIITAREWHGASDSHTVGALGLTGAAFAQIVLPGQPAREDAESVAALGLTSAAFTKVVFNGQPAAEVAETVTALGLTSATYLLK